MVHTAVCTAGRCRGHTSARLHERVHQPLTQLIHSAGPPHAYSSWQPGAWCQLASSLSSEACHSWLLASTATLDRALVRAAASSSDPRRLSAATTSVSLFAATTRTWLLDAAPPAVDLFVLSRLSITIRDYLGSLDPDFGHLYINHFDSL